MQINYTLKLVLNIDDTELGADSPKEYLEKRVEEDVVWLVEDSSVVGHTVGKIVKDEPVDEDADDDDLLEVDEDELMGDEI